MKNILLTVILLSACQGVTPVPTDESITSIESKASSIATLADGIGSDTSIADAKPKAKAIKKHAEGISVDASSVRVDTEAMQAEIDDLTAEVAALKEADAIKTKLWIRISGFAVLLGGLAYAGFLFYKGSIFRAAGIAFGAVLGSGILFSIVQFYDWFIAISIGGLVLMLVTGLVAAILHYRKHGAGSQEALEALGGILNSETVSGIKGQLNTAEEATKHILDKLKGDAKKKLAKAGII